MHKVEIEALISRCARTQSSTDYDDLFAILRGTELYLNFSDDALGKRELTLYKVGFLSHVIQVFTSETDPHLRKPFAGMQWASLLAMLLKMPSVDGLSVMNRAEDWVVYSSRSVSDRLSDGNNLQNVERA